MKHRHYKRKFCKFCKTNWTLFLIPLVHNRNQPSIMASHLHSKEWCTTSISGKQSSSWYCFPGAQEVSSLLGLPQCSAGCRLGLCSCLWLCTTIWWWQSVGFSSAELRSKPRWCNCASLPVPACLWQQPGLGWKEHRQPQGSCLWWGKLQPGRKLVGPSSAMEQLPQRLPNARPQELPRPSTLALTLWHHSHLLSAVNAGCSTPWLLARYYKLRISNNRKQSCLWR